MSDTIAVIDFGGQYTHLIANRIRRLRVYCEIVPPETPVETLGSMSGIILSGGPHSVLDSTSPMIDSAVLDTGIPILGLCYGHQLLASLLGGRVVKGDSREYGSAQIQLQEGNSELWNRLQRVETVWMSHGDSVESVPEGFRVLAATDTCPVAAMGDPHRHIYGLQFHPEVTHTPDGMTILDNFLSICDCTRDWHARAFEQQLIEAIRHKCSDDKNAYLLVSGGVDSAVCFELLNRALGPDRVKGLHIDNGLMRLDESKKVREYFSEKGYHNLEIIDASGTFLERLEGVVEPEQKRRIIGKTFIDIKNEAQRERGLLGSQWLLAQGTIYPDTIESARTQHADTIKTHHNRVAEIQELIDRGEIIEPLALLYKDEVRDLGRTMGMPEEILIRHPFPGPGLGVRILCAESNQSAVDAATRQETEQVVRDTGYSATVLPVRSVGVQGDSRSYAHPVLLSGEKNWEALSRISTTITNSIAGVNRVVYRISGDTGTEYVPVKAHVNRDRVARLQKIDEAITQLLWKYDEYRIIWQMPVVLLPLVNDAGEECVVLRPIVSREAMTANFYPLDERLLDEIRYAAGNIPGVGDIFFDVTHKPPATIEWE